MPDDERNAGLKRQRRSLTCGVVGLVAFVLWMPHVGASGGQRSFPDSTSGTVLGHVAIGEAIEFSAPVRVILMSTEWADLWNGAVQRSLDGYFSRYRDAIARNRDAYNEVAGWAYRDAAGAVISDMRRLLGEEFENWVGEVSVDGVFEFTGVPLGNYRVVVVAEAEERTLIWAEAVTVSGPIPQLIEVQNIIQ